MKRIFLLLLGMAVLLAACAPTQAVQVTEVQSSVQASNPENTATPNFPADELQLTETIAPDPAITIPNTPSPTVAPSSTPTPPPAETGWHWMFDPLQNNIISVNLSGEQRNIAPLDPDDAYHGKAIPLDDSSAVLFIAGESLQAFLLSLDGIQQIDLPPVFPYIPDKAFPTLAVTAISDKFVVFTYSTLDSERVGTREYPPRGPIFLIDLSSLSTRLVEEDVFFDSFTDQRLWFFASTDGRYLRYLSGDTEEVRLREMDLQSGTDRTITTTTRSPYSISASPDGELWYLRFSDMILDLSGNQMSFSDPDRVFRSFVDGKGVGIPMDCAAPCQLEVFAPFGNEPSFTYTLPWSIEAVTYYRLISRLLPGGDLLFVGAYPASFITPPTALASYSFLLDDDNPVFRLSPGGEADLVGIYRRLEFESAFAMPLSEDRRFLLLKSTDQAHYIIYDADLDRALFEMPIEPGLDYFYSLVEFFEQGILVHFIASTPEKQYTDFFHLYRFDTAELISWEDPEGTTLACPNLMNDGNLACWVQRPDLDYDFVRFNPTTGEKFSLVESVWLLETVP